MAVSIHTRLSVALVALIVLVAALGAAPAVGQDTVTSPESSQSAAPNLDTESSDSDEASDKSAADEESSDEPGGLSSKIGALPFTGVDLRILGGVAFMLLAAGLVTRGLSAQRGPTA